LDCGDALALLGKSGEWEQFGNSDDKSAPPGRLRQDLGDRIAQVGVVIGARVLGALIAGRSAASASGRRWLHTVIYASALAGALYVIVDIEFPRFGLIGVDDFDHLLADVPTSMK
jgi:hypothetical protein